MGVQDNPWETILNNYNHSLETVHNYYSIKSKVHFFTRNWKTTSPEIIFENIYFQFNLKTFVNSESSNNTTIRGFKNNS